MAKNDVNLTSKKIIQMDSSQMCVCKGKVMESSIYVKPLPNQICDCCRLDVSQTVEYQCPSCQLKFCDKCMFGIVLLDIVTKRTSFFNIVNQSAIDDDRFAEVE